MTRRRLEKHSIIYKLTYYIVLIVIAQAALISIFMISGGVLERAEENAFQSFYEKVSNRNSFIQHEMKNRWTNIDPYVAEMSAELSASQTTEQYLAVVMDKMINMLRTTQTTGVFVILNDANTSTGNMPSLYLRDYDPVLNDYSNSDVYMLVGPSVLAKSYRMPLDENWHFGMPQSQILSDFYQKPYRNAALSNNPKLLGYWSKPFHLFENDMSIMTYSMPLFDKDNQLRGVIGIELSESYMTQNMPATDLEPKDSFGFLLAYRSSEAQPLMPIITHGALQKRMLPAGKPLYLTALDPDRNLYTMSRHNSEEPLYACVSQIGLAYENSPFENEKWYLVGIMSESHLLGYVNRIKQILLASILSAAIIGVIGGAMISYRFSKPILQLAKQVRNSDKEQLIQLKPTGLLEVDELSLAVEMANNALLDSASRMSRIIDLVAEPIGAFELHDDTNRLFVTDQLWHILGLDASSIMSAENQQTAFIATVDKILACPDADEPNVYRVESEVDKWVKIKLRRHEATTLGVVIDVSPAMIAKLELMRDRDLDTLTKLWNRQAFQWRFENWQHAQHQGVAALLMFDLDNLKSINDCYGHKWGDQYIQQCAKALQSLADPKQLMVSRRSGDEFAMLLYDFPDKQSIRLLLDNFYEKLLNEKITFPDGSAKSLSISAGLYWLENNHIRYDELLHLADEALYASKRSKKGSYTEARSTT